MDKTYASSLLKAVVLSRSSSHHVDQKGKDKQSCHFVHLFCDFETIGLSELVEAVRLLLEATLNAPILYIAGLLALPFVVSGEQDFSSDFLSASDTTFIHSNQASK